MYPFIKQKDLKDCGCCSLLMILRYYGGDVSLEYIREITNTTRNGTNAYDLINGCKKLGFDSYGVKGDINDLDNSLLPCISHVVINKSYEHFIVLYKINKKKKIIYVADPNKHKIIKMSFTNFNKISTNVFIILNPRKKMPLFNKNNKIKEFLINFIKNIYKKLLYIIIISFSIIALQIILSFQFKIILDKVIEYNNSYNLIIIFTIFMFLILLKESFIYTKNKLVNLINHLLDKELTTNIYTHLLSLPYLYYKNRTTGETISRITDTSVIRNVFSNFIVSLILDSILLVLSIIVLFILSSKITIILLFIILLIMLIVFIFNPILEKRIIKSKTLLGDTNSYLVETISGIETVRNQNIIPYCIKNFKLKYSNYNRSSYKYNNVFILETYLKNILIELTNLIILVYGSYLILNNNLNLSTLITYITLSNYLLNPIDNLLNLLLSFKDAKISLNRLNELLNIEDNNSNALINKKQLEGSISMKHLKYTYNYKDYILKDVNINISPHDKVLIYGDSGCGKSTLAKIINKNLNVGNKLIKLDNIDINKYSDTLINKNICYISSKEKTFTDTILNNIKLDKDIKLTDLYDLTTMCLVNEFTDTFKLGFDTLLEEDSFNISNGQKQRITLARSLLNNANIYILDEALNQVDIKKERIILNNIFNKYKDKTFIVISHRFDNMDLFNKKFEIIDGVSYER